MIINLSSYSAYLNRSFGNLEITAGEINYYMISNDWALKKKNVSDDFTCIKVDYGFDTSSHSILMQNKSDYSDDKFDGSNAISNT